MSTLIALMIEAGSVSEMSVIFYETTRRNIPEGCCLLADQYERAECGYPASGPNFVSVTSPIRKRSADRGTASFGFIGVICKSCFFGLCPSSIFQ
jgi:hypothetical protein